MNVATAKMNWRLIGRRKGVTLVDLVITVLIIGILAAAAAPRFATALARLRAESGARRIASDLNYARRCAMQTSRQTTVTFRSSPAGYDMTNVEHPARPGQPYQVNLSDIDASLALTSFNFNGGASISFNTYGRPLAGNTALTTGVVTISSGGQSSTATVSAQTGEAAVP